MEHKIFKLNEERFLERCPSADLMAVRSLGDSNVWIDINQRDTHTLVEFLDTLKLHPLAVEACLEMTPNSRIGAYGRSLFIGLPTQISWNDEGRIFLSALCLPGMLITIHEQTIPALASIVTQFTSSMRFHILSTSAILYQILDHIIDQDMVIALEARNRIERLEDLVDQEADSGFTDKIRSLKRQLAPLEAILEDQHHCLSALQTIESESFSIDGLQDYFRDALAHLDHATRSVDRQVDRLTVLQQHYMLKLQDKTNKRLQLLTVVSAIFLPLMLVTGIYGMNFHNMPEITWRYGYFSVLLLMVLIAVVLLWFFNKKGWFK